MASFRDRRNPEAVRFPGDFGPKLLIIVGLFTDIVCTVAEWFSTRSHTDKAPEVVALVLFTVLLLRCWPHEIVVDQYGVHSLSPFGVGGRHIPWSEVALVRPAFELGAGWAARLRLRTDTLEIYSSDSRHKVVHTPRHPDRQRLLFELKQRGVEISAELLPRESGAGGHS